MPPQQFTAMDKIKAILNPGAKVDDDVLYDTKDSDNLGKHTGEGTHFGHSRTTHPEPTRDDTSLASAATPQTTAASGATNEPSTVTSQHGVQDDRTGGPLNSRTTGETAYEPSGKTTGQSSNNPLEKGIGASKF